MPASHWVPGSHPACSFDCYHTLTMISIHLCVCQYERVCFNMSNMCVLRECISVHVCVNRNKLVDIALFMCLLGRGSPLNAKCVWLLKPKHILYQQTHHHNAKCLLTLFGKHNHSQAVTLCNMLFIKLSHSILCKTGSV